MQIHRLAINKKKCLVNFDIHFHTEDSKSTTILIGENGTGKSTMMESILEILMSFDSPTIEKQIDYDYTIEYEYAQKNIRITKSEHNYCFDVEGDVVEGGYSYIRDWLSGKRLFPKRIITFYSGANNKLQPAISKVNKQYCKQYRKTMAEAFEFILNDESRMIPSPPVRKYSFCDEHLVPVYLCAILEGLDSYEKEYLVKECNCSEVDHVSMVINLNKVDRFFGNARLGGGTPSNLYFTMDYVEHLLSDVLRQGWQATAKGRGYFELKGIGELGLDSRAILEAFEVLHDLFDAKFETYVKIGNQSVSASDLSEGQRQLIKILGMLGICKREDCLFLLDEPDAHMNPKWKYGIKKVIDECLEDANNAQTIIATHDPLVINGVSKEYIRIFTPDASAIRNSNKYITKAIEPIEDTVGMGIDGLLQSEYYGLISTLDTGTQEKLDRKRDLLIKRKESTISHDEIEELHRLTDEIDDLAFTRSIPTDNYYDDFVAALHLFYREHPCVTLSPEEIRQRNEKTREIIEDLLRDAIH